MKGVITMANYKCIYLTEYEKKILLKLINCANDQLKPLNEEEKKEKEILNNLKEVLES